MSLSGGSRPKRFVWNRSLRRLKNSSQAENRDRDISHSIGSEANQVPRVGQQERPSSRKASQRFAKRWVVFDSEAECTRTGCPVAPQVVLAQPEMEKRRSPLCRFRPIRG